LRAATRKKNASEYGRTADARLKIVV